MAKMIFAGAGEKMQYLLHDQNDNTIRFVLRYPGLIDGELLSRAVLAMVRQADILHSAFYNDALNAYWIVWERFYESDYFQQIQVDGDPCVTARSLALQPIAADSNTQLRCYLVQNDRESAIALIISHLVVDGGDGKYLLSKLVESYNTLVTTGSCDGLEIKNGNRAPEQVYEGLSPKEIASLLKVPDSSVKSAFPFPNETPGRKTMVYAGVSAEDMSAARKKAKAADATANDLLLTALYRAYGQLPGVDAAAPASVMSMIDLRRHCDDGQSRGLSNISGTFPTKLMDGIQGSFCQTLEQVALQTRAMKDDPLVGLDSMPLIHGALRTVPMKLLMLVAGKIYGNFSLGLTNLGNLDCSALALGGLIPTEGLFGGPLKKKPGMQVSAASFDGACTLVIGGEYNKEDAALLQILLNTMAEEIVAYAKEN